MGCFWYSLFPLLFLFLGCSILQTNVDNVKEESALSALLKSDISQCNVNGDVVIFSFMIKYFSFPSFIIISIICQKATMIDYKEVFCLRVSYDTIAFLGYNQQLKMINLSISRSYTFFALQVYLKPHFNYNPDTDNLIPCKEAGLAFSKGDILHIVNKEDPNWWQVRRRYFFFFFFSFSRPLF